jgi:osmoprotectant transport system permease protein
VIYTIPSLALLAVAVKYLGLGFWPVVFVLAAYAQFILIRNIAAALRGVPAPQVDAALGLGFSSSQRFWRVEIPLAAPALLGGVRLTTVALIAIATLGGYVGAGGLGNEIFFGLQRQYVEETLAGSIPAALLAIIADAVFRGFERLALRKTTG